MVSKKILSIIVIFFLSSCNYVFLLSQMSSGEKPDVISMEMTSNIPNNYGNLIALSVLGQNFPWKSEEKKKEIESKNYSRSSFDYPFNEKRCETHSEFAFTYYTPKKKPKEKEWKPRESKTWIEKDDFVVEEAVDWEVTGTVRGSDGRFRIVSKGKRERSGRYKVNKSDIYIIHKGKKIFPSEIFVAQEEFDLIQSTNVAYSNYSRHATKFVKFPIPCNELAPVVGVLSETKLIISKIYKDDKVIRKDIEFRFIRSKENRGGTIWLE